MDNGPKLGFHGDISIIYTVVVAKGDAMAMIVSTSKGCRFIIEAPILIFINTNSNYSICGLNDSIPRVCYHTGPKGWMDQSLYFQYFIKPRAYQPYMHQRIKCICVDNCTTHNMILALAAILAQKQVNLKYLLTCVLAFANCWTLLLFSTLRFFMYSKSSLLSVL